MLIARKSLENPIRAELFGIERLEQHAESLATAQRVMRHSGRGRRLLPHVEDNGRVLRESYRVIANAIREERAITPAAEWLVDNFHVVDEQLREIRADLPPGFYRELPKLADARGEGERAEKWRSYMSALKESLEREAWDGDWYRRAFFDDGTPLGSAVNDACRMDSIAQSWSVISAAADPARGARAMAAVDEYLVRRADGLVLLFTPPFDDTPLEPGYIKGYVPGVRENGGQYTHAAIWSAIAFAALGDGDKAVELFAMLNPINHASTEAGVQRYKVEPYVVAADVYAEPPHVGRGGWTWYTGSAGWMYRAGVESILGFRLRGARLVVDPCIPRAWHGFEMVFRYRSARYDIVVENTQGVSRGVSLVEVDGVSLDAELSIMLADDRKTHRVRIVLG